MHIDYRVGTTLKRIFDKDRLVTFQLPKLDYLSEIICKITIKKNFNYD